ncbi:hypothetical protein [Fibrella arboris]|uniref:hypothetical protein n=1 Tax=Fibrella arboris TaxID=3242486 RepID=UPI003522E7DB
MPKHIQKWLIRIGLNFLGLLFSLGLLYVAAVVVVLIISTRAVAKDPLFGILNLETLAVLVGSIVAVVLVFRCMGNLYTLVTTPPKPE